MSPSAVISPVVMMGMWILQPASWLVILQVAIGLGFVIFVHELGHFLVAKACGVKCEKFYIGFDINGWNLGKFTWGETEYGIGILPLGGYVKMLGQDDNLLRRLAKPSERKTLLSQVICHQSQLMIHTLRGIHEVILPSRYPSEWQLFRPVSS